MQKALPAAQQSPDLAPLLSQMLLFTVRTFRAGRTLEGDFEQLTEKLRKAAQQPREPQPNPEQIKAQAQMQLEQHKQEVQAQQIAHQNELEAQRAQLEAEQQAALERMKMDYDRDKTLAVEKLRAETQIILKQMDIQAASESADKAEGDIEADAATDEAQEQQAESMTQQALMAAIEGFTASMQGFSSVVQDMGRPRKKTLIFDDEGNPTGVVEE